MHEKPVDSTVFGWISNIYIYSEYGGVPGDLIRIAVGFDFVVSANVLAWFELCRFMKFYEAHAEW